MYRLPIFMGLALTGSASAACPKGTYNDLFCSGFGDCNPLNKCVCDSNHYGYDCSQTKCPMGIAWAAPARATDDAHYMAECSNKGVCDRQSGRCICQEGFTGTACQRLQCTESCNGAGECLSLKQLSQKYAVGAEPFYETIWDAEMIYGCSCRRGYHGYDCSKFTCPNGDDPLTQNQQNEVQLLRCTAKGGFFHIFFNGEGTTIPFDASEALVRKRLEDMRNILAVKVSFSIGTTICNDAQMNAVSIEFTQQFGPQPPLKVFNGLQGLTSLTGGDVFAASGGSILAGKTSVIGTKEWAPCSNRGLCDEKNGLCACFLSPMPGFRSSDGYGNPGLRGDCGCADDKNKYGGPIKACVGEFACSGHGFCSGPPSYKCICERGWSAGDCSLRNCPEGPSWYTIPTSQNIVHNQMKSCSDAGLCDHTTGECQCSLAFTGVACDQMKCPGDPICNGHGQCVSIRQLSMEVDVEDDSLRFDYGTDPNNAATYDRDSILACKCDKGYEGYDCSQISCPLGDDPSTTGQVDEIQLFKCIADGGSFQLQFRTRYSGDIPFDASPQLIRNVLMDSWGLEDLEVVFSSGQKACTTESNPIKNIIRLNFPLTFGDLPRIKSVVSDLTLSEAPNIPSVDIADDGVSLDGLTSVRGTKENAVCSNKGVCNFETGSCVCGKGYASSDGKGNPGNRGDCGYIVGYIRPM